MPHHLPFALLLLTFFLAPVYAQTSETPTYYQDCSVLDFGDKDMSTMTEAEKIQALDDSLFGALEQSEECMDAAAQSSAQSVASAAGQGAGAGNGAASGSVSSASAASGGQGQSNAQNSAQSQESSTHSQTTTSSSAPSKQSTGGKAKGGSSAVCDAVIAGLQGATTEQEKAHFQALKEQYGCK
ncbi:MULTISPECIES: hypothetical protein [Alteromonas]|uniref:Uncharacterized protein n=1 Tax=Alteromonas mediterranea (strain DSM 17117 / CIP 110805 / LMG 28347 / Deep ecotype) TaxID=1774373 RepID=F2G720_ALTMD|nr:MULTISPECIES: hypothetical protein [Alteromonas]AEA99765.1 hypothetical protein MADE_1018205 [Alteromonas mediterranea DE]NQY17677.1 hypothetical protein [Alteromonas sp.]CAH1189366.1 hypothetical protein ISS312_00491 [Alteromonas mediterranea]